MSLRALFQTFYLQKHTIHIISYHKMQFIVFCAINNLIEKIISKLQSIQFILAACTCMLVKDKKSGKSRLLFLFRFQLMALEFIYL